MNLETMRRTRQFLRPARLAIIALHLVLVLLGALEVDFPTPNFGIINQIVSQIRLISGSMESFAFFAPSVPDSTEVYITLFHGAIELKTMTIDELSQSHEGKLRTKSAIQTFSLGDHRTRESIARIWAFDLFKRYPKADKLFFRVSRIPLPEMKEYRRGFGVTPLLIYRGSYERIPRDRAL